MPDLSSPAHHQVTTYGDVEEGECGRKFQEQGEKLVQGSLVDVTVFVGEQFTFQGEQHRTCYEIDGGEKRNQLV